MLRGHSDELRTNRKYRDDRANNQHDQGLLLRLGVLARERAGEGEYKGKHEKPVGAQAEQHEDNDGGVEELFLDPAPLAEAVVALSKVRIVVVPAASPGPVGNVALVVRPLRRRFVGD